MYAITRKQMRPAPFGMLKEEVEILILKNKSKKYSVRCF